MRVLHDPKCLRVTLNGLAVDEKTMNALKAEHKDTLEQVSKLLVLAKQSSEANDQVQSAMNTKKNGVASLTAFMKEGSMDTRIHQVEIRLNQIREIPATILKEGYLDHRGKSTELKTRQVDLKSSNSGPYRQ